MDYVLGLENQRPIMHMPLVNIYQSRREDMIPSQSQIVPEYTNICTSVLSRIKQVQEIDNRGSIKFKVFGIVDHLPLWWCQSLYPYSEEQQVFQPICSTTNKNQCIQQIRPPKISNFLAYNIESLNNTFTFKEDTIQPDSMGLVKNRN